MKDNAGSNDAPYHSCNFWYHHLKLNHEPVFSVAIPRDKG